LTVNVNGPLSTIDDVTIPRAVDCQWMVNTVMLNPCLAAIFYFLAFYGINYLKKPSSFKSFTQ